VVSIQARDHRHGGLLYLIRFAGSRFVSVFNTDSHGISKVLRASLLHNSLRILETHP
jgi:hypothetical protein